MLSLMALTRAANDGRSELVDAIDTLASCTKEDAIMIRENGLLLLDVAK
jgi:hypothetical protein